MKKGSVELGADEKEGESESKIMNQIFGCLQHPKNEARYLENIFLGFRSVSFLLDVFVTNLQKHICDSIYKNKKVDTRLVCHKYPESLQKLNISWLLFFVKKKSSLSA